MNKQEFVSVLAKKTSLSKSKCDLFLRCFKETIFDVCYKGGEVVWRDFGKFLLKERKARKYLNPQTKRYYIASPKRAIAFKSFNKMPES